jgi:O-antigen/teichoic acid export membrane protein
VPYILVAYLFSAAAYFFDSGFYITEKTIYKPFLMGTAACLIFLLYWRLIPEYGMLGGAYATVICYVVFASMTFLASNGVYPVEYPLGKMLYVLALGVVVYAISVYIPDNNILLYLTFKLCLLFIYVVIILFSGILERSDLHAAKCYVWSFIKKTQSESVGLS